MSNTAGDVATVHAALSGVAAALGLDALDTDNLHTAVGEACKNVMHHAYEGLEGLLELEVSSTPGALEVLVRDHGMGIRPLVGERTLPHTGIGLPIVHSLTRRITYTNLEAGGTEVIMRFDLPGAAVLGPPAPTMARDSAAGTAIALAPAALAGAVLPRVLVALATRAEFTAERLADVQLLGKVIAAGGGRVLGEQPLALLADIAPGALTLRIHPLPAGAGDRLLDADAEADTALRRVISGRELAADGAAETLELRLTGRG
jgi:anti-sigma regulatory factor (Ser/Thr protein kinase)